MAKSLIADITRLFVADHGTYYDDVARIDAYDLMPLVGMSHPDLCNALVAPLYASIPYSPDGPGTGPSAIDFADFLKLLWLSRTDKATATLFRIVVAHVTESTHEEIDAEFRARHVHGDAPTVDPKPDPAHAARATNVLEFPAQKRFVMTELPKRLEHVRDELKRVAFISGLPFGICVRAYVAHADTLTRGFLNDMDAGANIDSAQDAMAAAVGLDEAYRFLLAWQADIILEDDANMHEHAHYERVSLDKWYASRRAS